MADWNTGHGDDLIERCRRGDRAAFDELVVQEQHRITGLAYRITRSREDLDDLVQDIFFLVYRKIRTFRFESRFSTWLTRIAVNECLKALRRRRLRSLLFGDLPSPEDLPDGKSPDSALRRLEREEQHQALRGAVDRLPEKQRIVVLLRYFEELPCEEIAEVLGCNAGTVRSRLFNARKRLKEMMLQSEGEANHQEIVQ